MTYRSENEPLIKQTLLHVKDLDHHARETLGTLGENPYETPVSFMDDSLSRYDIMYKNDKPLFGSPLKAALFNKARTLMGYQPTIGDHATVNNFPITGGMNSLRLAHDLTFTTIGDKLSGSGQHLTEYRSSYELHDELPADDPRLSKYSLNSERYSKSVIVPTEEEHDIAVHNVLALTPDNLYTGESPEPTREQAAELYTQSHQSILDMFSAHNIDVRTAKEEHLLTFKFGNDRKFANVSVRVNPYAFQKVGHMYAPAGPRGEGAVFSPTAYVRFEADKRTILALIPLTDDAPISKQVHASASDARVKIDSYDELSYLSTVMENIAAHSQDGLFDNTGIDHVASHLEYAVQPVIYEPSNVKEPIVDFIVKRT